MDGKDVRMPSMPTPEEVESRIRAKAREQGRQLDAADAILINLSRIIGVDATDRYLGRPGA